MSNVVGDGSARRHPEVDRIEVALQRVRELRPRLPQDLADDLEQAAKAAQREAALLVSEIDELRALVVGLDPQRATAELKDAERRRAAAGRVDAGALDARVESARQRYVAVHTAWNALDDAERELGDLAARAEEAAARAAALTVERPAAAPAGADLALVTERIEALQRARAELRRLDDPTLRR